MLTNILEVVSTTYLAVLVAEVIGDKLLYATGVLATRFRWAALLAGLTMAFMGKMAVAVMLGATIGTLLPQWLVALLATVSFAGIAITMSRGREVSTAAKRDDGIVRGAMVAFATVFCAEWADKGMISAGAMAATWFSAAPAMQLQPGTVGVVVWIGAVAAMVTKGALVVTLGASLRQWIERRVTPRRLQYSAVTVMLILGALSVLEIVGILKG